jgi:hypothetical protein
MPKGKGTYGTAVGRPKKKPGTLKPMVGRQKPMRKTRTQGTKKGRMPLPEAQRKGLIGKGRKSAAERRKETRKRMGR